MNQVERVRDELTRVSALLSTTAGVAEWSPEWIADQGLQERQAELAHELELLEGNAEIEIRLLGGAERSNEVDAHFLSEFIQELQLTVASLVQVLMHGEQSYGPLPADVTASSRMRVGPSIAGSYVLQMSGPERVRQLALDMGDVRPPFDEAIERVLDLVDAAQREDDIQALESAISEFRSPRALAHVAELSRSLVRTQTTATITGRSPFADDPRQATMTFGGANRLQAVLSRTERRTETEFLTGVLSGVRWRRGIFDLELDVAGEKAYISGRVRSDLRPAISSLFDRRVRAQLERTTIRIGPEAIAKDSYLLVGVTVAEED
jgi:hypothetical protein